MPHIIQTQFKLKQWVKTVCTVYAGLQKIQTVKLTAFPAGTLCEVRAICPKQVDNVTVGHYLMIKIPVAQEGKTKILHYWARVNESCLKTNE